MIDEGKPEGANFIAYLVSFGLAQYYKPMIKTILKYPNPVLKRKSKKVGEVNSEIKKLAEDMIETLKKSGGVGLAAPQVGESKRVIVVNIKARNAVDNRVFINPEIVKKTKEKAVDEEGCLCLPGVYFKIKRAKGVEIKALDLEGREIKIKAEGLIARIFQHEIDHLDGILILDRLPFWQKWRLKKTIKMKKKFILLILVLGAISFIWAEIYLPKNVNLVEEKLFSIRKGQNLFQVAENLEKEGLIKNKLFFDFYVLMNGKQSKLQAGAYFLRPSENIAKTAKKIISGDTAKVIITVPEGFTVRQIEEKLNLKLPGKNLEGYLFPDTYHFPLDITGEEAVKMMRKNFDKKTVGLKITPEVITMASLIEKEVRTKEDKELVSGVLQKRLNVGMPLQVDAAMWTYQNKGLPPSPIANPGLESILAALYPKGSLYWYYLSTPEGKTIFSQTLEEHNVAKAKYLK
ncbi:MAG: peptide deformylase [Candidatus Wildermuthbacteria bacterium]|nr:peptide deformylase [Candidatus Wildermuthbacteria bacterium]